MNANQRFERIGDRFDRIVVILLRLLLMFVIAAAMFELYLLLWTGLTERLHEIQSVPILQELVQRAFGGALLIVLGLELLETLKVFFTEHQVRLELILMVAIIAVSRHIILLDLDHDSGILLLGTSALVLSLGCAYFLVLRAPRDAGPGLKERALSACLKQSRMDRAPGIAGSKGGALTPHPGPMGT
jgi:uncharacterized membrane protein (DUF373 family)